MLNDTGTQIHAPKLASTSSRTSFSNGIAALRELYSLIYSAILASFIFSKTKPDLLVVRSDLDSLQLSSMIILVNRHNAGFGSPDKRTSAGAIRSHELCLQHALRIAHMLKDFRDFQGDSSTLIGAALYNVTMAATTFVAEIFEAKKESFREEIDCLTICLKTMRGMEHTEIVAKNVFSIVQAICRVCRVGEDTLDLEALSPSTSASPIPRFEPAPVAYDTPAFGSNQTTLAMWPAFDFEVGSPKSGK